MNKDDPVMRVLHIFEKESDRGLVLVAVALVDKELEAGITKRLLPAANKREDELISSSPTSPLSSFSAKINLAHRLGILTCRQRTVFHQLRELRNKCAHDIESQSFDANHFEDRMKNILNETKDTWTKLRAILWPEEDDTETIESFVNRLGWRGTFECYFALSVVSMRGVTITPIEPIVKEQ